MHYCSVSSPLVVVDEAVEASSRCKARREIESEGARQSFLGSYPDWQKLKSIKNWTGVFASLGPTRFCPHFGAMTLACSVVYSGGITTF